MFNSQYQYNILAFLLGILLLQSCQSKWDVIQEEVLPESRSEVGTEHPTIHTTTLATLPTPWSSSPKPTRHTTATHAASPNQQFLATCCPSLSSRAAFVSIASPITASPERATGMPSFSAYKALRAASGEYIKFSQVHGQWQAELRSFPDARVLQRALQVVSPTAIGPQLAWLQNQDVWTSRTRIHVLPTPRAPYRDCVYVGKLGLLGGMAGGDIDSKSPPNKKQRTESDSSSSALETHAPTAPLHDVFISYVGTDKQAIAVPLCEEFKRVGIRSFVEKEELSTGGYTPTRYTEAMETARCSVFILSPEFITKERPMKELRYFLRRYREAKDGDNTPPLLVPVFNKLTWEDCEMTPQAFFKKYKDHLTVEQNDFTTRKEAGETSIERVMEDLKSLNSYTEAKVKREAYDYQLIHQIVQTVHKEMKKFGLIEIEPSSPPTYRLHDHIGLPEVPHYVSRDAETQAVYEKLAEDGVCVIHGYGGSGKSTLAVQYAQNHREDRSVIRLISITGLYALTEEFQRMAQELGKDWGALASHYRYSPQEYHRALGQLVYNALAEKGQRIFLILDDAKKQHAEAIKNFALHKEQDRAKIIITTRDPKAFKRQYPQVMLADFCEQEGRAYVSQQLQVMDRENHSADVDALLKVVGQTPMKLELAMGYLDAHEGLALSAFLQQLQEDHPKDGMVLQVEMGLEELSELSQQVMRYSTLLDAASIPLTLLSSLIEQDHGQLVAVLDPLVRLSLIKFLPDRQSIRIHREVQSSCRYYSRWSEGANGDEDTLLNRLVRVLRVLMPWAETLPDTCWETGRLYAPHVSQVLSKAPAALGADPATASLLRLMGNYQAKVVCDYKQACAYQEQALAMRQTLYGDVPHPDMANSLDSVGISYQDLGNTKKGLAYKEQSLEMRKAIYGNAPHPDLANSLDNVGHAYYVLGEVKKGLKYFEQTLVMRKALYGDAPHPDVARSLNNVGSAYHTLGDVKKGLEYQMQGLEMKKAVYGDTLHPDIAHSLDNVGVSYNALGDVKKRLTYQEQALAMRKAIYGDATNLDIANSLNNVGNTYYALDEAQKGLQYFEQALEMMETIYGDTPHLNTAKSLNNVGNAYHALGDLKKGLEYQMQGLEMRKVVYGDTPHPDIVNSLDNVGISYEALGDVKESLTYQEQALAMRQTLYGDEPHLDLANALDNVGASYETLGEVEKGLKCQKKALEVRKAFYGNVPHPNLAISLYNMGDTYLNISELSKAMQCYEEALKFIPKECTDIQGFVCHNLGCIYHTEATKADNAESRQAYWEKATEAFEAAIVINNIPQIDTITEYANFLIATEQLSQAYTHLIRTIAIGDSDSELNYGLLIRSTASPILRERITQNEDVTLRAVDYAYYLLIHHYEDFVQVGIQPEKTREDYLNAYKEGVESRAGQPSKEKQDGIAQFLLENLSA